MPHHHRDVQKQVCLGALGAGAMLGLPQLFVQSITPQVADRNSKSAATVETNVPGKPKIANAMGSAPVLGLAFAGTMVAAKASCAGRSGRATARNVTAARAFENELGVQAPAGFWDPLGLAKDGDLDQFKRRRSVEIKHGRVSMLAAMGYMTPEITGKWPGYLSPSAGLKFADIPNGLAAVSKVPAAGWFQILAYGGYCEIAGGWDEYENGAPGDYGFKVITSDDPEVKTRKLNAELANGRLAMMAIIGMFFQDGLTGSAWGDWALYTGSPLRAFENELGVQAPVGFWDPLGFTDDGDEASFKRRRSVEIKHGRICMLATMGYITPEITGKLPGYLSPSAELKFEDIPNGLSAISKVPAAGWVQIIAYFGFCEFSGGFDDYKTGTPGDYGFKVLTSDDPDEKTKKLAAEIANGRLAMVAIIGMFFQDGLTGSAWGDWALYTDSPLRAESDL